MSVCMRCVGGWMDGCVGVWVSACTYVCVEGGCDV